MLILGSSSQFRQEQLKQIGVEFKTHSPDIDEDSIKTSGMTPLEISRELSLWKAKEVQKVYPDGIIIGGDQVLNLQGEIFSKPGTAENAINQLRELSGKTHELITSYAIVSKDQTIIDSVISQMTMRELSDEQILKYVKLDNPIYSCGSYKLETIGIALFEKIECPDHSAIIGLPLITLTTHLKKFGINVL